MDLDGKFGAKMEVHIQNDGPVTIELTSPSALADPKLVCLILALSVSVIKITFTIQPGSSPQMLFYCFNLHLFNNVSIMVFNIKRLNGGSFIGLQKNASPM